MPAAKYRGVVSAIAHDTCDVFRLRGDGVAFALIAPEITGRNHHSTSCAGITEAAKRVRRVRSIDGRTGSGSTTSTASTPGDMNHWNPTLFENRNLVPASTDPNYHLTTDLADKAVAWVRQAKSIAPDPVLPWRRTRHRPRYWVAGGFHLPFAFTGKIHKVMVELGALAIGKSADAPRAAAHQQTARV
jgi:hypothetical protein